MRYLLDSNVVIGLVRPERRKRLLARVLAHVPGDVVTSTIVAHELYFGAAKSARLEENRRELAVVLDRLEALPFTREDAEAAGEIRAALARAGLQIGPYDVLIAGQALARGLVLVTNNGRKFGRVEGLVVEDWL